MNTVEAAIKSKLGVSSVTDLLATSSSIFNLVVPKGYDYPLILFNLQGGGDLNDTPTRAKELLYQIKALSAISMYEAGTIDTALDAVLHGAILTVSGQTNYWCARESDVRYAELLKTGTFIYYSGGIYRIGISE